MYASRFAFALAFLSYDSDLLGTNLLATCQHCLVNFTFYPIYKPPTESLKLSFSASLVEQVPPVGVTSLSLPAIVLLMI